MRGSVSTMLIFAFGIVSFLLVALSGLQSAGDLVLLQRSRQFLEQVASASYVCLDLSKLAVGCPALQWMQAKSILGRRFYEEMPEALKGRLQLDNIEFLEQVVKPDPDHWMGSEQPLRLPVVILRASYMDHLGRLIPMSYSIELLLD
jgi:hypothetical protein